MRAVGKMIEEHHLKWPVQCLALSSLIRGCEMVNAILTISKGKLRQSYLSCPKGSVAKSEMELEILFLRVLIMQHPHDLGGAGEAAASRGVGEL